MVTSNAVHQGDIWWVEQPGARRRPALVLTRERSIDLLFDVLVAPLTTTIREIPTEVQVGPADGVPRASVIDLQHVMTVPKSFLRQRVAVLPGARWPEVCAAMRVAIGC